jgi:hypothetical protein
MPKECIFDGCTYNQFGGKYCRNHQWCRTDKKPKFLNNKKQKPLNRTPVKKISKKKQKGLGELKLQTEKDRAFYLEIWEEREHVCFESGEPLGNEPLTLFFHHVLEKGIRRYKKYRYCKWNIVLITWRTHDQVGMDIDRCPKIKEYREHILKTYVK